MCSWGGLAGHEDGVDDVDDAVRLEYVRGGDGGRAALGVSEHDVLAGHGDGEVFTLYGLEGCLAVALLDHRSDCLELMRPATTW